MPSLRRPPTVRLVVLLVAAIVGGCASIDLAEPYAVDVGPAPSSVPTASASPATPRPGRADRATVGRRRLCRAHVGVVDRITADRAALHGRPAPGSRRRGASRCRRLVPLRLGRVHQADGSRAWTRFALSTDEVQALATEAATGRVGFLVAANQEGGRIQGLSGPGFDTIPRHSPRVAGRRPSSKCKAARWGRELLDAGRQPRPRAGRRRRTVRHRRPERPDRPS